MYENNKPFVLTVDNYGVNPYWRNLGPGGTYQGKRVSRTGFWYVLNWKEEQTNNNKLVYDHIKALYSLLEKDVKAIEALNKFRNTDKIEEYISQYKNSIT